MQAFVYLDLFLHISSPATKSYKKNQVVVDVGVHTSPQIKFTSLDFSISVRSI